MVLIHSKDCLIVAIKPKTAFVQINHSHYEYRTKTIEVPYFLTCLCSRIQIVNIILMKYNFPS